MPAECAAPGSFTAIQVVSVLETSSCDAWVPTVASKLPRDHFGFGFSAKEICVYHQVWPLACGQFDLVVLDPGGQGPNANKHDALPVRKRVDCVDNPG
jgi:hypothetical protein